MPSNDSVPALIQNLNAPKKEVRISALEALGELRDPRALEPMLRLSRDKRYEVQRVAGRALGMMGDMRAFDTLLQMYNGETYPLIESDGAPHQYDACLSGGAIGLGLLYRQTGDPAIFELLTNRFRSEIGRFDQSKTPCTVQGLAYTGDQRVTLMLIQAAESSEYWLHYCGLEALGILGDPAGLPTLYAAVRLGDPLTFVWAAADALALLRNPEAEQALADGLNRLAQGAFPKDQLHLCDKARTKIIRALGIIRQSQR